MLYGAMNFPVIPVLKEIEILSGLGFDYMELTMDPPRAHYQILQEEKGEIIRELEKRKMSLICHLPTFVSTADLTDSIRESSIKEVIHSLEVADQLGAKKVVIHPGFITGLGQFVLDRARGYAIKAIDIFTKKAESLGLTLCIENMFPRSNFLVEPEDFVEIFKMFPNLKMTLDPGHANIEGKGEKRTLEFIRRFPDRIYHIHANDNFGKEDNHLPIGAGIIDYPKIMKALKEIGYDGTITLEVFSRDREYLRISKEKIAKMVEGKRLDDF
jgi:sugar phosphate isomerase/epimerase